MNDVFAQTRIALIHILNDLAEDDYFGLITFDSNIFHWKRELVQANKENVDSAKTFAQEIRDRGGESFNKSFKNRCERLLTEVVNHLFVRSFQPLTLTKPCWKEHAC